MGFLNKTRISVFSAVAQLVQPDPDALKTAMLHSTFNDYDLSDVLMDGLLGGMGIKVDASMGYARDEYSLGLPNNYKSSTSQVSDTELADIVTLDLSLPYGCIIRDNYIAAVTPFTTVVPFLLDTRGYQTDTEIIKNLPTGWALPTLYNNRTVYQKVTLYSTTLEDDNVTITLMYKASLSYSVGTGEERLVMSVPTTEYQEFFTETRQFPADVAMGKVYYVAGYKRLDSLGAASAVVDWWYYSMDSGKYPLLNPPEGGDAINSYPVIPIRYNNSFMSETNNPEVYRTGSELLRRMGASMDSLVSSLDTNPDIAQIDHAYVMFGVDLQTDDDASLGYLVDFFDYLSETDDVTVWDRLAGNGTQLNTFTFGSNNNSSGTTNVTSTRGIPDTAEIVQTETVNPTEILKLTEHGLKITITYDRVSSYLVTGSIGVVGTATKSITAGESITGGTQDHPIYSIGPDTLLIRKQIATNTYREVKIVGLVHSNMIYGSHGVITIPTDVLNDVDEHNLVIPLHMGTVRSMRLQDKSSLYDRSFLLVITGYQKTTSKWYESTVFTMVVMVAAVVLSVVTLQPWITEMAAAATTAWAAGSYAMMLFLLETAIEIGLTSLAMQYATETIAAELGPELTMVLALTAMAVGVKIGGSFSMFGKTIPTGETFMMAGSAMMQASNTEMNNMIEDVATEDREFSEYTEEQWEILDEKRELLGSDYLLPFNLLDPPRMPSSPDTTSKPGEFYDQKFIGNIGTLVYDMLDNFVAVSLVLPESEPLT